MGILIVCENEADLSKYKRLELRKWESAYWESDGYFMIIGIIESYDPFDGRLKEWTSSVLTERMRETEASALMERLTARMNDQKQHGNEEKVHPITAGQLFTIVPQDDPYGRNREILVRRKEAPVTVVDNVVKIEIKQETPRTMEQLVLED